MTTGNWRWRQDGSARAANTTAGVVAGKACGKVFIPAFLLLCVFPLDQGFLWRWTSPNSLWSDGCSFSLVDTAADDFHPSLHHGAWDSCKGGSIHVEEPWGLLHPVNVFTRLHFTIEPILLLHPGQPVPQFSVLFYISSRRSPAMSI